MKIRLAILAGVFGVALLGGSTANATPTLVGTTTNPTGIDNLVVDGTNYNVTFSTTTLNSFNEASTLSFDASFALASALNALNVTDLGDATVSQAVALDVDNSLDLFQDANCNITCTAGSWFASTGFGFPSLGNFEGFYYIQAADFSAANVPEPSSLPMLLAGLSMIGGAFYFGRKKAKSI
jgi:hypothetical protein